MARRGIGAEPRATEASGSRGIGRTVQSHSLAPHIKVHNIFQRLYKQKSCCPVGLETLGPLGQSPTNSSTALPRGFGPKQATPLSGTNSPLLPDRCRDADRKLRLHRRGPNENQPTDLVFTTD